jgi:cystathionine beta-lyase
LASIENGARGLAFLGLAATDCLMRSLKRATKLYHGRLIRWYLSNVYSNIQAFRYCFHYVDMNNLDNVTALLNEKTK